MNSDKLETRCELANMNFRITTLLFALLLTTLWIFGLMISHRKREVDQAAIVPSLQSIDAKVDKVVIKNADAKDNEPAELEFVNIGDHWFLKKDGQQMRVEDHRINEMVRSIKDARADESADLSRELSHYGLVQPRLTVLLSGKVKDDAKEWKFFVGKESPEQPTPNFYYVNSSERDQKAFAVARRPIEKLFVKDVANLRSKRLFDFVESGVTGISIQKGDKKLEIKRGEGSQWVAVEPKNLGFLGSDSAPAEDKDKMPEDKFHPKKKTEDAPATGVKALLGSVVKVTVADDNDFVPLGKALTEYDLDSKTAPMRIEIATTDDAKNPVKDTLLIGKKVANRKEPFYYARLATDDGVFMLSEKTIEPIEKALADPGKLRSLDVAVFDAKTIDFVTLQKGKEKIEFFMPVNPLDPWLMFLGTEKRKSNDTAVSNLINHLLGKKEIVEFLDLPDADKEKKLAEWGLKTPAVEVAIYANAIDRPKKDEKDEKKDAKDKKDEEGRPNLKKDLKATLKLEFGNVEKDHVFVRRTLENGTESYFKTKKEFFDKIIPAEGAELAYLATEVQTFSEGDVLWIKLVRKTDKGSETIELERHTSEGTPVWYVKDPLEPTGLKLAESKLVSQIVARLAQMNARKWVKKLDEKEDLEKFGLKNPTITVSVRAKKHPEAAATLLGMLAGPSQLAGLGSVVGHPQAVAPEVFEFGSEATDDKEKGKDKLGTYARYSGSKMLFIVPTDLPKLVKESDLRDRGFLLHTQARVIASLLGGVAADPVNALLLGSPYVTGQVHQFDPEKVKEIRLAVRTPFELRNFHFERVGKDKEKTWTDKLGIPEFQVDSEKVAQFVKDFSKLRGDRIVNLVGGPRGEHKLGPKECTVKLELVNEDGSTITLLVGTSYLTHGYYAHSSYWPETVFMIPANVIDPLLRGAAQFAKERLASN